jgi:hypothetical protein
MWWRKRNDVQDQSMLCMKTDLDEAHGLAGQLVSSFTAGLLGHADTAIAAVRMHTRK